MACHSGETVHAVLKLRKGLHLGMIQWHLCFCPVPIHQKYLVKLKYDLLIYACAVDVVICLQQPLVRFKDNSRLRIKLAEVMWYVLFLSWFVRIKEKMKCNKWFILLDVHRRKSACAVQEIERNYYSDAGYKY